MFWNSAGRLNAKGLALDEAGDSQGAERLYTRAREKRPGWSVPWYNLGLLYKRRRAWPESLRFNRRATELKPEDEAAWWNLGIAATALSDWATARAAWTGFGLEIPDGEGPLSLDLGIVCIRLEPDERGEVVWCERIDPARAVIRSVPLPEAERRSGDVLLHDGEPRGKRTFRDREVPVFDEIEVWEPSNLSTYSAVVEAPSAGDVQALADLALPRGLYVEDWSRIRYICKTCSEGTPGEHAYCDEAAWSENRQLGISATDERSVDRLLDDWRAAGAARSFNDLKCELSA